MHTIKAEFPNDWPYALVYPLADWHIGDQNCILTQIGETLNEIEKNPYALAVLNGDLMNTALKTSVSDVYSEMLTPMQQVERLVDMLLPIKDKIIGVTTGNHENRVYRNDGLDLMRLVCRELGIEDKYAPEGVLIFLSFGQKAQSHHTDGQKQTYTIYATHGSGGGRKEGAKAIRLADMGCIVDSDVFLHSHTHLPMIMKENYFRVNMGNGSASCVERLFVNTAASLGYGGYGQSMEFKPNSVSCPVIRLESQKKKMTATM